MQITIYCLKDPRNNEIRYIGRTKNKLSKRLSEHLCNSKSNHGSHKIHWINSLIEQGIRPIIEPLKVLDCSWEESHLIEKDIIKFYLDKNSKLTNLEDKGPGSVIRCISNIKCRKAVLQYSLEGYFIKEHVSLSEAALHVKGKLKGIHKGLNSSKTAYNFQWKYKNSDTYPLIISPVIPGKTPSRWVKVNQYDLNGVFIKTWDNITEASLFTKANNISMACKGIQKSSKGFIWKYAV